MKTRPYGSGSIFQRSDGRWVAQVRDGATGRTVQRSSRSERTAKTLLRKMTSRVDAGRLAVDKPKTFGAWTEDWLKLRAERTRTGGTVAEYERNLRLHVLPHIGGKRLGAITVLDVEQILDRAHRERNLSASSLNNIKKSIGAVLTDAVRDRALATNVARGAVVPLSASPAKAALMPTPSEVQALLFESRGTEVGRALVILATTGARVGELLGARWADVDLETGLWSIERTVSRDRANKAILGSRTKNKKTRTLRVAAIALEALKAQRQAVITRQMSTPQWTDHDLVFPSQVGSVMDPSNFRKQLDKVRIAINRRANDPNDPSSVRWQAGAFHALRHYFASVGLTSTEAAQVQQLLGHTTLRMTTTVYGHLTEAVATSVPEVVAATLTVTGTEG
jgi:integrase